MPTPLTGPTSSEPGIEMAIVDAIRRELDRQRGERRPLSSHPVAIAAQDRRRVARLAQRTRELREAERRRQHRHSLEHALEAARAAEEDAC